MTTPYSFVFKYIIIGDSGIGKSSILQAYTKKIFNPEHMSTVGIEFGSNIIDIELKKNNQIHKDTVKVQIWDTAGQERFQAVTGAYYRGSIGVFIVYDITNKTTFNNVKMWYERFINRSSEQNCTQFTIIGNKSDRELEREVSYEEGKELAESLNANFYETSCKYMENVEEAMIDMTNKVYSVAVNTRYNEKGVEGIRRSRKRYYKGEDISHLSSDEVSLLGTPAMPTARKRCCK